jgi:hypothetical protein
VTLEECSFEEIKREDGNGSVIRWEVSDAKEMVRKNCSWNEGIWKKANGWGIHVMLGKGVNLRS